MIDGTEKPKIPFKSAKRGARYNEFNYNDNELTHAKTSGTVTRDREKNIDQQLTGASPATIPDTMGHFHNDDI